MIRNEVGNSQQDAYLRITISRGVGDIGLDPALCPVPTVVIMTKPLVPAPPALYETGVTLVVAIAFIVYDRAMTNEAIAMVDDSRSAKVFASFQDNLNAQIPSDAPGWK